MVGTKVGARTLKRRTTTIPKVSYSARPTKRAKSTTAKTSGTKRKSSGSTTASKKKAKKSPVIGMPNYVKHAVKGMHDPFYRGGMVRIPDGSASHSFASPQRTTFNIPYSSSANANKDLDILVFPGLSGGVMYYTDDTTNTKGMPDLKWKFFGKTMALDDSSFTFPTDKTSGGTSSGSLTPFGEQVDKWRLVSMGLKLTQLNTDSANDGWFEAIRLNAQKRDARYAVVPYQVDGRTDYTIAPGSNMFAAVAELAEDPSYVAGSLKDIHKHQFHVRHETTDHSWAQVRGSYEVAELGPGSNNGGSTAFQLDAGDFNSRHLIDDFIDMGFDMVLIRVHQGANGGNLLAELAANYEHVYTEGLTLDRLAPETDPVHSSWKRAKAAMPGPLRAAHKAKAE